MEQQKRVAAIHDISGFGKCSLTVVLPILSAAGIESCAVPTAVLSSHTGGIPGYTYCDLTGEIPGFIKQWHSDLNLSFDAVYSGFLGSFEQISLVSEFFDTFRSPNTMIMVDPVMGDNGRLYKTYTSEMAEGMKKLCEKADIIVPNLTEAAFLLGEEFYDGPYTRSYIEHLLAGLSKLGPRQVVLTGVWFSADLLGSAGYDRDTGTITYAFSPRVLGSYFGTGDIFGSSLLGALLNGMDLKSAMQVATDFTGASIRRSKEAGTDQRFGVNFEAELPAYMKQLGLL